LPTVAEGEAAVVGATDGDSDQRGGLLNRILEVETSRVGEAFWLGVRLVFGIFACLAAYILLRWVWRKVRRSLR